MHRSPTYLVPGHAAWAALNAEKREALLPDPSASIETLLGEAQALSGAALALVDAVERAAAADADRSA